MKITERIDAITHIAPERLAASIPAPRSVKIELVGRCNLQCFMCGLRQRAEAPAPDMDLGFFKRITREMREAGVEEIGCFYLGESTLNWPLLVEAVKYLKG